MGEYKDALAAMDAFNPSVLFLHYVATESNYYHSLILAALCNECTKDKREEYMNKIEDNQKMLGQYSGNCYENFGHKYTLVCAEQARLRGKDFEAVKLYTKAIEVEWNEKA